MAVRGFFYNATDLNDKEHMYNGQDMNEDKARFTKRAWHMGIYRSRQQAEAWKWWWTAAPDRVRIHQFAHHTQYGTADPHVKPGKRYTSED